MQRNILFNAWMIFNISKAHCMKHPTYKQGKSRFMISMMECACLAVLPKLLTFLLKNHVLKVGIFFSIYWILFSFLNFLVTFFSYIFFFFLRYSTFFFFSIFSHISQFSHFYITFFFIIFSHFFLTFKASFFNFHLCHFLPITLLTFTFW